MNALEFAQWKAAMDTGPVEWYWPSRTCDTPTWDNETWRGLIAPSAPSVTWRSRSGSIFDGADD